MLDLTKLSAQVQAASFEWRADDEAYQNRLKQIQGVWQAAQDADQKLMDKLLQSPTLPWSMGRPLEALREPKPLPAAPVAHRVLATDGSQISPSYHEISPCYLINIGKIDLIYGCQAQAQMSSEPFLYYRQQDLFTPARRQQIGISEAHIALERSLMEFQELAELATGHSRPEPTLAMIDGALYNFLLEMHLWPDVLQKQTIQRLTMALSQLQSAQIPLCAYISQSRRHDILNLLRLQRCPFEIADCDSHCPEGQEVCQDLFPMSDREWLDPWLRPGERSPLFVTTAEISPLLKGHEMCFFYLHVGVEIARIELPRWVADQPEWLERVHALAYLQAEKGRGYPIALAEAHNRAVIKGSDRQQFYAMLSRRMIREQRHVRLSHKELKKRRGVV